MWGGRGGMAGVGSGQAGWGGGRDRAVGLVCLSMVVVVVGWLWGECKLGGAAQPSSSGASPGARTQARQERPPSSTTNPSVERHTRAHLWADRVGCGGEPHRCEPRLCNLRRLPRQLLVPGLLGGLPVETLQQHLKAVARRGAAGAHLQAGRQGGGEAGGQAGRGGRRRGAMDLRTRREAGTGRQGREGAKFRQRCTASAACTAGAAHRGRRLHEVWKRGLCCHHRRHSDLAPRCRQAEERAQAGGGARISCLALAKLFSGKQLRQASRAGSSASAGWPTCEQGPHGGQAPLQHGCRVRPLHLHQVETTKDGRPGQGNTQGRHNWKQGRRWQPFTTHGGNRCHQHLASQCQLERKAARRKKPGTA